MLNIPCAAGQYKQWISDCDHTDANKVLALSRMADVRS